MNHILQNLNKAIIEINKVSNDPKSSITNKAIGMYLKSLWDKNDALPNIKDLAKILYISPPNISKFINKYKLEKYQVLKYIFYLNSIKDGEPTKKINNDKFLIEKAYKKIKEANKVLLIGMGNSGAIAKSMYTNLVLKNINGIYVDGLPDQLRLIEKMTEDDLIICISHSFSHDWINKLTVNKNKKVILITSNSSIDYDHFTIFCSPNNNELISGDVGLSQIKYFNEVIDKIIKKLI